LSFRAPGLVGSAFARRFQDALFGRPTGSPGQVAQPLDSGRFTQALILAAGRGSRLGEGAKCLCEIGGRPLIEHQLEALSAAGVDSVGMVVGFEQENVREIVGGRAAYILNESYADTNSLYSFLLARNWVVGDVLVLNCDVLFPPYMPRMLQSAGHENALLFDSSAGDDPEEMKVALHGDSLDEMSKELPATRTCGENVGVLRLERHAARHAFKAASRLVANGGRRHWLASAINATARGHRFKCVDVAGMPWTEIDFPHDLERARRRVWPAILAGRLARLPDRREAPGIHQELALAGARA
jgi:choline kinase